MKISDLRTAIDQMNEALSTPGPEGFERQITINEHTARLYLAAAEFTIDTFETSQEGGEIDGGDIAEALEHHGFDLEGSDDE